ncbi:unnamed protein product [Boreogadus saida]
MATPFPDTFARPRPQTSSPRRLPSSELRQFSQRVWASQLCAFSFSSQTTAHTITENQCKARHFHDTRTRHRSETQPVHIPGGHLTAVEWFRFPSHPRWTINGERIADKAEPTLFFLRQRKERRVKQHMLLKFFASIIIASPHP